MTRRKKRIKKSVLMIIILTILISIGLYFLLFSKSTGGLLVRSKDKTAKFDYTLDKDNTNLMKENFKELKDILANDNINYEDYAKTLAKLFIVDLYKEFESWLEEMNEIERRNLDKRCNSIRCGRCSRNIDRSNSVQLSL